MRALLAVLFAAMEIPAPPAIEPGGVWNAASRMPPSLPGGAIAQGSRFTISGVRLGPEQGVAGSQSHPPTILGGTSVRLLQGPLTSEAGLLFASAERIEAVMPRAIRPGPVRLTVTYQGRTSDPYELTVVDSSFGFFTNANAPAALPEAARPLSAAPGEMVTLWGTGLGGMHPGIFVGGVPAGDVRTAGEPACCRGVDAIAFRVPHNAPLGCTVPVQAFAGGRPGNVIAMSLHLPGQPCRDEADWFRQTAAHAANAGYVVLAHISFALGRDDFQFDYAIGSFGRQESGQRPFPPLPPLHTCTLLTDRINLRALYGTARAPSAWTSVAQPTPGNRRLDAGAALALSGPDGARRLTHDSGRPEYYSALLGGQPPFTHGARLPLFAARGAYTISAPGGPDIGPFSASFRVPAPLVWTNRARTAEVRRAAGVTLEWKPSRKQDAVMMVAASADSVTGDAALCLCMAPAGQRRYTIPPLALAALPPSSAAPGPEPSYLLLLEIPLEPPARIHARGLDEAFAAYLSVAGRLVTYR